MLNLTHFRKNLFSSTNLILGRRVGVELGNLSKLTTFLNHFVKDGLHRPESGSVVDGDILDTGFDFSSVVRGKTTIFVVFVDVVHSVELSILPKVSEVFDVFVNLL